MESKSLAEALRAEIRRALDDGDFSIKTCAAVERLARAAKDMLAAAGGMPVAQEQLAHTVTLAEGSGSITGVLAPTIGTESFGARAISELIAMAPKFLDGLNKKPPPRIPGIFDEDPVRLVQALKDAREAQLPAHIIAALEAKLTATPLPDVPPTPTMEDSIATEA